jgi:GT2 family glycosyltransferase
VSESSRVIAVVLHYQREAHTAVCVEALAASKPVAPRILIVDNNSGDGSAERLRAKFPQHDFLQTVENLGYAGGNARGSQWALAEGAEFVLVINDDAEVEPSTVATLVAALESHPRAAAVGPTIRFDDAARSICWAGGDLDLLRALGTPTPRGTPAVHPAGVGGRPEVRSCTFLSGCCFLVRAAVLRELGTFREEFFAYAEDVELSLRFTRGGWGLLHAPSTTVVHHTPYPEPTPAPWKIAFRDFNRRRLVASHYSFAERVRFALWFYPTRVALMLRYAIGLDFLRAGAIGLGMTTDLKARKVFSER